MACVYLTYQSAEPAEERVPEVAEREGKVLVEEVAQELAHAVVRPAGCHWPCTCGIYFGIKKLLGIICLLQGDPEGLGPGLG